MDQLHQNGNGALAQPTIYKVAVGICLKGHTPPASYHDRMMMAFQLGEKEMEDRCKGVLKRYEFNWFSAGEIFVPFARDSLADLAIKYRCDYLFMVDDDMLAPPDLFYQLVKHDVDIIAPLAFTRNPPHNPVIYECIEGYDKVSGKPYFINNVVKSYPRGKLVEVDAVGFGAALIKTSVFKRMKAPYFMSTSPTGEDVLFCYQARKAGARVYVDTSIKLGHLSHQLVVTEEYSDQYNQTDELEREEKFGKYQKYPSLELT